MRARSVVQQKISGGADKLRSARQTLRQLAEFLRRDPTPEDPASFEELAAYCDILSEELEMRAKDFFKPEAERLDAKKEHGRLIHQRNLRRMGMDSDPEFEPERHY